MKILIVNLMQIGDLVLTTSVFEALRKKFPNAFIAAAVNKSFAQLVDYNPFLDRVFHVDKSSWRNFFTNLSEIRALEFDFAFNFNRSERASALAALSNAKRIAGYSKPGFALMFSRVDLNLNRQMHQVFSNFHVLNNAGLDVEPCRTFINVPDDISKRVHNLWLKHFNQNDNVIAFNVGASWASKRWLPQYFAQLANMLTLRNYHIAFVGSKADLPIVNECLSFISDKRNVHVFTGKFSLLELTAFFDHCNLIVTNDSGPMHIAVARNRPTLSFFGSSPVTGFYPFHSDSVLLKSKAPCHPCYKHSCPRRDLLCMALIRPQLAFLAAIFILSRSNSDFSFNPIIF